MIHHKKTNKQKKKQSKQSTISLIMKLFHVPTVLLSFQHYYDIKMTTVILVNR